MQPECKILIIEDDKSLAASLGDILSDQGYKVEVAENYAIAQSHLSSANIVILDLNLPGKPGIQILKELKETNPLAEVLIMTGYADVQSAIDSCNLGAFAYIKKPVTPDRLLVFLKRALEKQRLTLEVERREYEIKGLTGFTGTILNDRVRLLEQDKEMEEKLSMLYRGIDLAFHASSPVEAARKLLPLIAEVTKANNASLNVIGTDGKVIDRADYYRGVEPFKIGSRSGGTRREVITTKKPVIITDLAKYPNPNPDALAAGIQSMCTYPLIVDDVVCGTLFLASLKKNAFAGMEQIIVSFTDLCAIPLRQSILYMETEKMRKMWETTLNLMRIGVVITDRERNVILANKPFADMVKVPLEELPGKTICQLVHGHPQQISECPLEKLIESKEAASIVIKEDFLNIKRLELRVSPILDARGEISNYVHILRDLDIFKYEDRS